MLVFHVSYLNYCNTNHTQTENRNSKLMFITAFQSRAVLITMTFPLQTRCSLGSCLNVIFSGLNAAQVLPCPRKWKVNYEFIMPTPFKPYFRALFRLSVTGAFLRSRAVTHDTRVPFVRRGLEKTTAVLQRGQQKPLRPRESLPQNQ